MDREKRETAFAEQYLKLRGPTIKCKDALEVVQNMGYTKTLRTMNRHIASVCSTGHALSVVKKVHRRSSLNDDQMSELNSWILGQNTKNIPVGYSDVQKCINDKFNIKVHLRTAGKILHRLGHTKKTCQSKTVGFTKTNAELKTEYMHFITKMKNENKFVRIPSEIRSIDVTYTKKPPRRLTTFSPKGGGQQRAAPKTNLYTNAIVTMISGDGRNRTPCMLFTHDPKMRKEQKDTHRGKRVRSEFDEALQRYNISEGSNCL
jgi:transposase